jgi:micrococcal nuclease
MKAVLLASLFLSVSFTGHPNLAGKQECRVVRIIDGDTIDCLIDYKTIRVRLHAIDAPEKKQDFYTRSKEALSQLCQGKNAVLVQHGYDRYHRLIADLYVNNQHINYKMVELGMAWHFKKYSSDINLAELEKTARNHKKGLWSLKLPIAPWDYRAMKKHLKHGTARSSIVRLSIRNPVGLINQIVDFI